MRREEVKREEEAKREEVKREAARRAMEAGEESILRIIIGKAGRVCGELFEQFSVSQNEIAEQFKLGTLPMGFSDNLLWKEIVDNIQTLPSQFQEQEERITKLTEEEMKISNALKELDEQKMHLETNLRTIQAAKIALQDQCQPWLSFKGKYKQVATFANNCAAVEEQLAAALDEQLAVDPSSFTAELKGDTPLSLVFNAFGMSAATIKKLHHVDAKGFLDPGFLVACKELDLPPGDQYDLAFLHNVFLHENLNQLRHEHMDNCPICSSDTSQLLCYLIEEHKESLGKATANPTVDITDLFDFVNRFNITGRKFLGASVSDLRNHFPNERFAEICKIHAYFKNFHLKAESTQPFNIQFQ